MKQNPRKYPLYILRNKFQTASERRPVCPSTHHLRWKPPFCFKRALRGLSFFWRHLIHQPFMLMPHQNSITREIKKLVCHQNLITREIKKLVRDQNSITREQNLITSQLFVARASSKFDHSRATILLKSRSSEIEASGLIIRRKGTDLLLIA